MLKYWKRNGLVMLLLLAFLWSAVGETLALNGEEHMAIVSSTRFNVLYVGLQNPVDMTLTGVADENTTVSVSNGEIEKLAPHRYDIRVFKPGKVTIELSGINKEGEMIRDWREMRALNLKIEATVAGRNWGSVKTGEFKAQRGLAANIVDVPITACFNAVSYRIIRIRPGKKSKEVWNKGGRFEEAAASLIKKAQIGDTYIFDEIEAMGPSKSKMKTKPVVLRIE